MVTFESDGYIRGGEASPGFLQARNAWLEAENAQLIAELDNREERVVEAEAEIANLRLALLCDQTIDSVLNKTGMYMAFEHMQQARTAEDLVVLAFVDINNFKLTNSEIGHTGADDVLAGYASHLVAQVREGDAVTRFGGDEFTVLANLGSTEDPAEYLQRLARPVSVPYRSSSTRYKQHRVTTSVGYIVVPLNADYETVVRYANKAAMYIKEENDRRGIARTDMYGGLVVETLEHS